MQGGRFLLASVAERQTLEMLDFELAQFSFVS